MTQEGDDIASSSPYSRHLFCPLPFRKLNFKQLLEFPHCEFRSLIYFPPKRRRRRIRKKDFFSFSSPERGVDKIATYSFLKFVVTLQSCSFAALEEKIQISPLPPYSLIFFFASPHVISRADSGIDGA